MLVSKGHAEARSYRSEWPVLLLMSMAVTIEGHMEA